MDPKTAIAPVPRNERRVESSKRGRALIVTLYGMMICLLLVGGLAAGLHATSEPSFCASCHEMEVPYYQMWKASQHRDVDCTSCHVDKGFMPLLEAKTTRSFHDLYAHFITGFETPIHQTHPVRDQACLTCHPDGRNLPDHDLDIRHTVHAENGVLCQECHRKTSHAPAEQAALLVRDPALCEGCHQAHSNFSLTGAHAPLTCADCHSRVGYQEVDQACTTCHRENDPHGGQLGQDCAQCHVTDRWQLATFDHDLADFQLTGTHVRLACSQCHKDDVLQDIAQACDACHTEPGVHLGSFGTACSSCHTTDVWSGATFNHAGFTDCWKCHAAVAPADHFPGQCSQCHTPATWSEATFDHTNAMECQSCHAINAPANHFPAPCSQCHSSAEMWSKAVFDHTGFTDCRGCHAATVPANHFSAQCSQCHLGTETWTGVVFDHTGFTDCRACHAGNAPANHFPGQCSQCHINTETWRGATFNHTGFTDCRSCHAATAPPNHFTSQCSWCHSTGSWSGASLSQHTFPIDHNGAGGNCETCHPDNNTSGYTCFNCHSQSGVSGEHQEEGISDFQNCVQCHPTGHD